jgi:hypothetical protein
MALLSGRTGSVPGSVFDAGQGVAGRIILVEYQLIM